MQLSTENSNRIHLLRTILIVGIVILHIPPSVSIPSDVIYDQDTVLWFKILSEKTFFRASVPTLSVISGFLFFLSYPKRTYTTMVVKKTKSLLIPFLIWNLPLVFMLAWLQRYGGVGHSFRMQLFPFDFKLWLDACFALTDSPINFPLGFLRDLFVCVLLSPLLLWFLKHARWLGLVLFSLMVIGIVPHPWVLRGTILLGFYLGGWLALSGSSLSFIDKTRWLWLLAFCAGSLGITFQAIHHIYNPDYPGLGQGINALRLLGIPAFWALSGILVKTPLGLFLARFSPHTFFLFCAHGPLLVLGWLVWEAFFGGVGMESYGVFFCIASPLVVLLSWLLEQAVSQFFPSLHQLITGQRLPTEHASTVNVN